MICVLIKNISFPLPQVQVNFPLTSVVLDLGFPNAQKPSSAFGVSYRKRKKSGADYVM